MRIYFATNRDRRRSRSEPFGERFHADGPHFYRVGAAEVERVSDDPDDGYAVRSIDIAREREPSPATGRGGILGSTTIFEEIRARAGEDKRDILIYIHGFANTFENALQRAAQLRQAYLIDRGDGSEPYEPHTFAFSWPANGRIQPAWEYFSDRDDAAASGVAMARALQRLLDFLDDRDEPCRQRLHLVAHSMGNWALRHAVTQIRALRETVRLPKVFDNIFLMAADEDADAFEHNDKLGLLPDLGRTIHVYHSMDDRALAISDTSKFNPDRLGTNGPRTFSGINSRIHAIDAEAVDETTLLHGNHQYYRLRAEVIADVRQVLAGRRPEAVDGRDTIEPGRRYRIRSA